MQKFGDKHDAEVDEALRSLCTALADLLNEFKKQQSLNQLQPVRARQASEPSRLASSPAQDSMPRIPWEALSQI